MAVAPFEGMFRDGATWRFSIKIESTHWDDADPEADKSGNVTSISTSETSCRVIATSKFPGGRASEIECTEGTDWRVSERMAGAWIQTADGLWHDSSLPDEGVAPTLDPADRFLAADQKPDHQETTEPEGPDGSGPAGGSGSTLDIEPTADGWCVTETSWGGDESWQKVCLDSTGPASGGHGFSGGSSIDITFERID